MAFSNAKITVMEQGKPLQDAFVVIGSKQARTDGLGIARFDSVPEGRQDIVIINGANKHVIQTSIRSSEMTVSVSNVTTSSTQQPQIQPKGVNLLDLGEQSITILGIALLALIVLGGIAFIIFFKKNIEAYQRQLKQVGMLAVLGAVAGVSALIYSQTDLLSNKSQANKFTQSTRADTRQEIPSPTNIQVSIGTDTAEFKWDMQQTGPPIAINGYHVEWVPQADLEKDEAKKNMVVKERVAVLPDLVKGVVYVTKISTIDADGNFSPASEFIFYIPEN